MASGQVRWFCVLALLWSFLSAHHAAAQDYPNKPIRLVVPFAPGGNADIIARILIPKMSEVLGQPIVIDNRGGAGGTIGTEAASRAVPDGYTLLLVSAAHVINPAVFRKLPYDSIKDFTPISMIADVPTAFVVHPSVPVNTVSELIEYARGRPGRVNYSTAGRGTIGHLAAEMLAFMAKLEMVHVSYKGSGPSVVDLLAGHVHLQFSSMPAVIHHARAGRLRMLAQTGPTRSPAASEVPTMEEAGVPGFVISSGFGLLAPAGVARPMVDRIYKAVKAAIDVAEVARQLAEQGTDPIASTPDEYDAFNRSEIAKWARIAREANIQPE